MAALFLAQDADMESTNDLLELNGQKGGLPEQKRVPQMEQHPMEWSSMSFEPGNVTENIAPEGKPETIHPRRAHTYEMNPLPGMQSDTGRMLWGMAEHAAIKEISKKHKTLGKALPLAMALIHAGLARNNWRQADSIRGHLK